MRTSTVKTFSEGQAKAITDAVLWVRDQAIKEPPTLGRRRDLSETIGTITADIAAGESGTIDIENSGGTVTGVTAACINPHDVTLEQGLRVRLEDWSGWDDLVAVPVDYSSCEDPDSPQPIPIS